MTLDIPLQADPAGTAVRFEADEPEIALLKAWFLVHSPRRLLLRKGEDFGGFALQVTDALLRGPRVFRSYAAQDLGHTRLASPEIHALLSADFDALTEYYLKISQELEMTAQQFRSFITHVRNWLPDSLGTQAEYLPPGDLRILCRPDERNERARRGWEAEGYRVRHYKRDGDAGSHRLYIAADRYAVFFRTEGGRFFGLLGEDTSTITRLTQLFEDEWRTAKQP